MKQIFENYRSSDCVYGMLDTRHIILIGECSL